MSRSLAGALAARRRARRGVALIIVSWLVILLSLWGVLYLRESLVAGASSGHAAARLRAKLASDGAIEKVLVFLADETLRNGPGRPQPWQDPNEVRERFAAIEMSPGVSASVVAYDTDAEALRYGLDDEASKLHIGVATKEMLEKLPGMTPEAAAAIIDWRDEDDEPQENGAEGETYGQLPGSPYTPKNAPFETIGELLLVHQLHASTLFGEDRNLNGRLDRAEDDGDESGVTDDGDGALSPGLWRYVTVHSWEPNTDAEGNPRVNVNTASQQELQALGLSPQQVNVLMAARAGGMIASVGQLGALPQFDAETLKQIIDGVTVHAEDKIVGLVNIITASRPVLLALPSVDEDVADAIMAAREGRADGLESLSWVIDAVGIGPFVELSRWITVRSHQFRFQAQGWAGSAATADSEELAETDGPRPVRAYARQLVVVDVAGKQPKIVYRRDLRRFGPLRLPTK